MRAAPIDKILGMHGREYEDFILMGQIIPHYLRSFVMK